MGINEEGAGGLHERDNNCVPLHLNRTIGEGNGNHSSVLAWRIPGTGKPGGLLSMGSHRVGHD